MNDIIFYSKTSFCVIFQDNRQQILTTSVWLRLVRPGFNINYSDSRILNSSSFFQFNYFYAFQRWKDEHLQWNSSLYGGLNEVHLSPYRVWKPDITVMNEYVSCL